MKRYRQRLSFLDAYAVGALEPARLVEELLCLVGGINQQGAVIGRAGHVALNEGFRQLPICCVDCVDDLLPIDAGLKRLTHLHVTIGRKLGIDRPAIHEAKITRRRDRESLLFKGFQLLRGGIVSDVGLPGLNRGDPE